MRSLGIACDRRLRIIDRVCRARVSPTAIRGVLLLLLLALAAGCAPEAGPREPLLVFGEPGRGEGQFHFPRSVDFLPDGTVLVMDRTERIQRFSPEGEYRGAWLTPSVKRGNPRGLD